MLVTPLHNRRNRFVAWIVCVVVVAAIVALSSATSLLALVLLALIPVVYWLVRRKTLRRRTVIAGPFPPQWEVCLNRDVEFFRRLDEDQKQRFRDMVKVFIDETPITGIRTEVDDQTRVLVAASAIIPVFGFDDWEYSGLGEVLIYPSAFDENYAAEVGGDGNILGMVGVNHLSGVMILSKPALISGFANPGDKRNVGIHEFAHLVDKADGSVDGLPAGIPAATVAPWIQWVAEELDQGDRRGHHIDGYAYTNQAEYLAVLTEYFFEEPETLQRKNPQLYEMLQSIYRQDTKSFLAGALPKRRGRVGRNSPCLCGSGKKFKRCCGNRRKKRK